MDIDLAPLISDILVMQIIFVFVPILFLTNLFGFSRVFFYIILVLVYNIQINLHILVFILHFIYSDAQ